MQYIRGACDAAGIDDDDKGFEPSEVHCDAIDPIILPHIVQASILFANLKILEIS
jgi:hypothetical protein